MDELLKEFHLNLQYHENALNHAKEKGMELNELNVILQPQTWDILTDLIERGEYHTKPPKICYLDKRNGQPLTYEQATDRNFIEVRELYVMDRLDRVIWNMFYQILYNRFEYLIHPLCTSYKKGMSTRKVACDLSRKMTKLDKLNGTKNDFRKYFDSVPIKEIDKTLNMLERVEPSAIWKPIKEHYHDNRVIINGEMVERYGSLKQGNALGCFLADLILADVDEMMSHEDVIYYRYSDDCIILGEKDKATKARIKMAKMISEKGLKFNDKKTEYLASNRWFTFLGFKHKNGKISVGGKTLDNIIHKVKIETLSKCRQKKRALTDNEIRKAIDNIQYYFFVGCEKCNAGMGSYLFGAVNDENDINVLDRWIKDCIRACKTNKCNIWSPGESYGTHGIRDSKGTNVRANIEKTYGVPENLGWYSLNHMYKAYKKGSDYYNNEINLMRNEVLITDRM